MTNETLYKALRSVADSHFNPCDWAIWWGDRVLSLREIMTPSEFRRLNITPDDQRSYTWMLSCQREAEAFLTARQVPFQHGTRYEEEAARERSGGRN